MFVVLVAMLNLNLSTLMNRVRRKYLYHIPPMVIQHHRQVIMLKKAKVTVSKIVR